jgi:ferredoxin-NADP reductase/Na+-transporting NADH:ubiquinone oxidoreductase subunit NqrB
MTTLDAFLNRITMYRLALYVLLALVGIATVLAFFQLLHFSPLALLLSTAFLLAICWAMNTVWAFLLQVPTNLESALITALILALLIDPARSPGDLQFLGWAAILAMSSKYVLAIRKRHVFNPAAIAVVLTALVRGGTASWWIGTASMAPAVLLGGWLVVRKGRQEEMVVLACVSAVASTLLFTLLQGRTLSAELPQLLLQSPLFFLATIMLTEPLTVPPTRMWRLWYSMLTGVLVAPLVHLGPLYSTPELALVAGNLFSYLVSSKQRVVLKLQKKARIAPGIVDFVFKPSHPLAFVPGQYMEFTLGHARPDSRGNRRYFTLASSPTETTVHLGVRFYEKSSSFKRALYWLDSKTPLVGSHIAGDFTLPADPGQKLVFLAGGIGITPFRSMLKYLLDTGQKRDIVLIYATKTEKEIAYQDILRAATTRLGVRVVYTLTDTQAVPRQWHGRVGRISEQLLMEALPDYPERLYYLSGPPDMVRAYEQVLKTMQIRGSQIKKDFFPGLV